MDREEILDLLAFFVAQQGEQELIAHQDEDKILASFRLWKSADVTVKLENIALDVPQGRFAAKTLVETLRQSRLFPEAGLELGLSMDGLSFPPVLIPSWAVPLVPTAFELGVTYQIKDADKIARAAIATLDLRPGHALDPAKSATLQAMAMGSEPKLILAPGYIFSQDLKLYFRGEMTFLPRPQGSLTLEVEGLDKALAHVQDAAKSDPKLQQAVLAMALAKGLAKPGADGEAIWVIDYGADGSTSVNGQRMGRPAK